MPIKRLSERIARHDYVTADREQRTNHYLWCPGCSRSHVINVVGPEPWGWDGNVDGPTYTPSLLVTGGSPLPDGRAKVCHSFVVAGVWQFLGDSTHDLAGQHIPMVTYPEEHL
jgi:hypothetical protein